MFDDFLPPAKFAEFWRYFQDEELQTAHSPVVKGVWRVDDGHPLLGPQLIRPSRPLAELLPPGMTLPKLAFNQFFCPTGKPVDGLLDAIVDAAGKFPGIVGTEHQEWIGLLAQLQVYPVASALSWHRDLVMYSGAFVFYAHPEWNSQWGGELLIADPATKQWMTAAGPRKHQLSNEVESEELLRLGMGRYIAPKPNRLVLLAGSDPHAIAKVNPAAGHHVRASLSGFFISPNGVKSLIQAAVRGAQARGS